MSKVYITNDTGLNFSRAADYGELVAVTTGPVPPFHPDRLIEEVDAKLRDFDETKDYLMLSGSALVASFAMLSLDRAGKDYVRLLLFDSKKRDYFVRTVPLE